MEGKDGRTERATLKRRNEQRRKGNLCVSQEIVTVLVLLLGLLGIRYALPHFMDQIGYLYTELLRMPVGGRWEADTVQRWFINGSLFIAVLMAPIFLPAMAATIIANMLQTGPFYSTETLHWKFGALNPVKGCKQLFSTQATISMISAFLKIGLILLVVYLLLRSRIAEVVGLGRIPVGDAVPWMLLLIYRIALIVTCLFILIAAGDWCFRKYRYERDLMMTKKEVEDERKQQEPSPIVKRSQMRKMRELTMQRMMAAVPKATVVVTNPTHVAVALEYDPAAMGAPRVTAKGLRLVAERIKRIAREHNVPVIERPEVARDLYKNVKVGREIPARWYGAIAEILAYLYRIGAGRIREEVQARGAGAAPARI